MDFKKVAQDNAILKIRVGSHLFGTSTPESDEDYLGVFMPPEETVFGFQRCEEVDLGVKIKDDTGRNTKDAVDFKAHDYRKFVRLVVENNPNFLHAIFVNEENILFKDEDGFARRLLSIRNKIPYKGAFQRFVCYADSQLHKMRIKPANYKALEEGLAILDESHDYKVIADLVQVTKKSPFRNQGKGKHIWLGDLSIERGVFVKKARKMVRRRLNNATNRATLFTKYGYDLKFASNLIHLLMSGRELMETGTITFPLSYAQDILEVKQGRYTIDEILEWAEQLREDARAAYNETKLQSRPWSEAESFVISELRKWMKQNEGS